MVSIEQQLGDDDATVPRYERVARGRLRAAHLDRRARVGKVVAPLSDSFVLLVGEERGDSAIRSK